MMWRLTLVALAIITAVAPLPAHLVEQQYSARVYPALQRTITPLSNASGFAWFDLFLAAALALLLILLLRRGRILNVLALVAVVWLLFFGLWGLNYRRVPLQQKLPFDASRITVENVTRTAREAVVQMNRLHAAAHAAPAPSLDEVAAALAPAMSIAARQLALAAPAPSRPKETWLDGYFRRAGIDGMTDPFFHETLLVSNLVDVEKPAALAHEWGHLAGLADESEASYFGWLTCLAGDEPAQYSGWVALYPHLLGALPQAARASIQQQLGPGPRNDFRRIAARLQQTNERVRLAANTTYDKFLKANRVEEGIESYDAVVRLVVGTGVAFAPARQRGN
jgi:signal transduction histidine kinase